jgi:hypothetical protein
VTAATHAVRATHGAALVATFAVMLASASRLFRDEQMHWTLHATCSRCHHVTIAPLLMGIPVHCDGCQALIKIDPKQTIFHR